MHVARHCAVGGMVSHRKLHRVYGSGSYYILVVQCAGDLCSGLASTLTVTGLCLPISMHGPWFRRARRAADMRRRAIPTGGCESVRFKERRGREIFGELYFIYQCVEVYIVPQLYLIVYAVSEIFWEKVCTLSSIVPFSNFFA